MENNKYYTPEISEFHVGFEYEWCDGYDNIWVKETVDINTPLTYFRDDADVEHRVKTLDREDIESCGWVKTSGIDYWRFVLNQGEAGWPQVVLESVQNKIAIFYLSKEGGDRHTVFIGDVKNVSELKRLMKQLNITK